MAIIDGTKLVTTAGTRERISATSVGVNWLMLQARPSSGITVVVGGSTVVAAAATRRGVVVPEAGTDGANTIHPLFMPGPLDLNSVWLDILGGNGEGVIWMADQIPGKP